MGAKKKGDDKSKGKDAGGGKGGKGKGNTSADQPATKLKGGQAIEVRQILCTKHAKKEEALTLIREKPSVLNFTKVAVSHDEDKPRHGGYLGWKTKGSLMPQFEEVAYGLEVSHGSTLHVGEVKTDFGYHIIIVEGRR